MLERWEHLIAIVQAGRPDADVGANGEIESVDTVTVIDDSVEPAEATAPVAAVGADPFAAG